MRGDHPGICAPLLFPAHLSSLCTKTQSSGSSQPGLVLTGPGCVNMLQREPGHHGLTPCKGTVTFHVARCHTGLQVTARHHTGHRGEGGRGPPLLYYLSLTQGWPVARQPRTTSTKGAGDTKCPVQASATSLSPNRLFTSEGTEHRPNLGS